MDGVPGAAEVIVLTDLLDGKDGGKVKGKFAVQKSPCAQPCDCRRGIHQGLRKVEVSPPLSSSTPLGVLLQHHWFGPD